MTNKYAYWMEAFKNGDSTVKGPPWKLWVEPTNKCTVNCIHCFRSHITRGKGFMELSLFKDIIDQAASLNPIPMVSVTGHGESLMHPEIGEMVKYSSERCKTEVITNATILTEKKARKLLEAEPHQIAISFDGPSKEVYEQIRRGGNYERTVMNIKRLLELKHELGSETLCSISIIKEPLTEDKIGDFKKWCATLPFDYVRVNELLNFSGENDLQIEEEVPSPNMPLKNHPVCYNAWASLCVHWDGSVIACLLDFDDKFVIGNVCNDTIMDIWNGERMQTFRKALVERRYGMEGIVCAKCNILWRRYDTWIKSQRMSMVEIRNIEPTDLIGDHDSHFKNR